jgi:adenylate cyclase
MLGQHLAFGPFVLNPEAGTLLRKGAPIPLSYRALLLLTAFLNRPGEVLTKSDLIDAAWQGAAVEEGNLSVQIAALRKLLGQMPEGGDWITTVPRVGYRFAGTLDSKERDNDAPGSEEAALARRPSIAVMPFDNVGGDREQEYFADGMVEDIITGLSRIKWLLVIARNSSLAYKGKALDVRQVGRELGVRYIVQGSVRKEGRRVRITAQLLDAVSGMNLWADRFDGSIEDVFDLQDQIAERVVAIVEPNLQKTEIERSRRKRPESLDAYDLYLRAVPYTAAQMPDDARVAMRYLEDALRIDPGFAAAHALIAWCHEWCFTRAGFDEKDKMAALLHARTAIVSSTDDATALAIGGFVITMLSKDHEAGLSANERALALNPSCATAMYLGAVTYAFSGHAAAAMSLADRALRLSPFDVLAYQAHLAQGTAAIQQTRYEDAASHYAKALQANPSLSSNYFVGAAAFALAGRIDEARSLASAGLKLEPGFRLRLFSELMARELADRFIEGGRQLGLPE